MRKKKLALVVNSKRRSVAVRRAASSRVLIVAITLHSGYQSGTKD